MAFRDGFKEFPRLTTKRLCLRPLGPEDASAYFDGLNTVDPQAWGLRWGSLEETRRALLVVSKAFKNKATIGWAITDRRNGALLGEVKLFGFTYQSKAEIAYWLTRRQRGKGYGSEAVLAAIDFGFNVLQLHRIEAYARPDNVASCHLLEKLGFQREGLLRKFRCEGGHDGIWNDQAVYGLLREDVQARSAERC